MRAVLGVLLITASAPALADLCLSFPLDCTLGQSCTIEDYVDLDPGPGMQDYTCAFKTRDGHSGTDFHLLSFEAMEAGVDVLAAAPGVVSALRDGMADVAVTPETAPAVTAQGCGNAVRIDHGEGWQTLYCHMKQGSVAVHEGDAVDTGTLLGQVGLSGLTNAPHLHLTVLKDGAEVDPFLPDGASACGARGGDLWETAIPYDQAGFFTVGFSDRVPNLEEVQSGAARVPAVTGQTPLVLYGHVFFAEPGDVMRFVMEMPDGTVRFDDTVVLEDPQRQLFRAIGRRAPDAGWPPGPYRGYVQILRGARILAHRHAEITVTSP